MWVHKTDLTHSRAFIPALFKTYSGCKGGNEFPPLDDALSFSTRKASQPAASGPLRPYETLTDAAPVNQTHNKWLVFLPPTFSLSHYTALPESQVWVSSACSVFFLPWKNACQFRLPNVTRICLRL